MRSNLKKVNEWKKSIEVEIPKEEINKQREKVYKKFQKNVKVDGFRKGKVPKHIIERKFSDSMKAELIDELLNSYFKKVVDENDIKPISPGKISDYNFKDDGTFQFTAEIEVEPEIDIKDYIGLKLEKEINEVTPKEVEDTIELLREQNAELKPVEKKAEEGNIIEGDIQAIDTSGVPIIGEKYLSRSIEIGKPPLGDLCKDQLVGLKPGDEKRLEIPIPKEGKSGEVSKNNYLFKVKALYEKKVPEINEEFIKKIGVYDTIDEFKQDIKDKLKQRKESESRRKLENSIRNSIIRNNTFELPPSMVERTMDYLWEEEKNKNQNLTEADKDQFIKTNKPDVINTLKWNIISDKIVEKEDINVSDEDLEEKIEQIAGSSAEESKKVKNFYKNPNNRRRLKDAVLNEEIMDFIIDHSKVKEIKKKKTKKKSSIITPG